jgi:drug/metabolite transporter (DMT)-like permease
MDKDLKIGILIMFLCTLFTAVGQLFFKYGSVDFEWNLFALLTNYDLVVGFIFYAVGAMLLIMALKFGKLSILYPFVALTFIWVMLISVWFLGESLNNFKFGAMIFIVLGIILITGGNTNGK